MLATENLTDRIKVEIMVKKGLLGYPGSPSQYYIAVVGSGPQLGQDNPAIAPRCKRISNNVWMKEIWVKKESRVSFNFLIVHGPTNTVFETERVSPRRIFVKKETFQYQARFNEADSKNERDVTESNGNSDDRVGKMDMDREWQTAFSDMGQKIKFEKLLLDRGDVIKVQFGVHQSVLETYNRCAKAVSVYAERIGLQPAKQTQINTTDDISHQQLWVRKDLLETFLTGKNNGKFKLKIDEIEPQKTSASRVIKTYTTKQSGAVVLQKAKQTTNSSLTAHTTRRTDRSLSPVITELTVDHTPIQSIAKAAGPGSSREVPPTSSEAPLQCCSMISYEGMPYNTHTRTKIVRYCADVAPRSILTDFPDRAINEALSDALDKPQALSNKMLNIEADLVKEISLELDKTSQLETNTGLKTTCTSISTFKDNPRGENTGNDAETQEHFRKSPSTWTIRSCKKGLVLVAVGLGVVTCLRAFVFR